MKILLDSCALVDLATGAATLNKEALQHFSRRTNEVYVSAASFWELGIKRSLGKLDFDIRGAVALLPENHIHVLNIDIDASLLASELPYHHKDPCDRIIIATAKLQDLAVMTSDSIFEKYEIDIIRTRSQ
ncbi:type II toxin-antitoxin system VapC family toxin [Porticoccus sp. GXU_MW_L64]